MTEQGFRCSKCGELDNSADQHVCMICNVKDCGKPSTAVRYGDFAKCDDHWKEYDQHSAVHNACAPFVSYRRNGLGSGESLKEAVLNLLKNQIEKIQIEEIKKTAFEAGYEKGCKHLLECITKARNDAIDRCIHELDDKYFTTNEPRLRALKNNQKEK